MFKYNVKKNEYNKDEIVVFKKQTDKDAYLSSFSSCLKNAPLTAN